MKNTLGLMALLLLSVWAAVQLPAQKKTTQPAPAADPCKDSNQKRYVDGLIEGAKVQLLMSSDQLSDKESPISIKVLVEDIDGSDAFRLAAAEIIRTHFLETLKVEPDAQLTLYIGGSKRAGDREKKQTLRVEAYAVVKHNFLTEKERHWVPGTFIFADDGTTVVNYSPEETTQVVREEVYKVLSDFLKSWNASKEKAEEPKP